MCHGSKGCQKPEGLKGKPQDCSAEQVRKCHGDVKSHPCVTAGECEKPEKLHGRPEDCSPEQIRKCHGEAKKHPCARPTEGSN